MDVAATLQKIRVRISTNALLGLLKRMTVDSILDLVVKALASYKILGLYEYCKRIEYLSTYSGSPGGPRTRDSGHCPRCMNLFRPGQGRLIPLKGVLDACLTLFRRQKLGLTTSAARHR